MYCIHLRGIFFESCEVLSSLSSAPLSVNFSHYIFFHKIFWPIETKLGRNVHWMVLDKVFFIDIHCTYSCTPVILYFRSSTTQTYSCTSVIWYFRSSTTQTYSCTSVILYFRSTTTQTSKSRCQRYRGTFKKFV